MLVVAALCLCAAALTALLGVRALARPAGAGTQQLLRALAPAQLAAAVMLAAGGVVALSARPTVGLLVLCVGGAFGTVAAGAWQSARHGQAVIARSAVCAGTAAQPCATCTLSCR